MEIIRAALKHVNRVAVLRPAPLPCLNYCHLLAASTRVADQLQSILPSQGTSSASESNARSEGKLSSRFAAYGAPFTPLVQAGQRVALMMPPSAEFVSSLWGTWLTGGIAVPLALSHPGKELAYVLQDSGAAAIASSSEYLPLLRPLASEAGVPLLTVPSVNGNSVPPEESFPIVTDRTCAAWAERPAALVYTSGTTGRPKGVVHTHLSLASQVHCLVEAWEWVKEDRILHCLPLHHVHGLVNALLCPLHAGAAIDFMPRFSASSVWDRWQHPEQTVSATLGGEKTLSSTNIFMGVPTMYVRLIQAYEKLSREDQELATAAVKKHRLMVSGSSACPVPVMHKWQSISSHLLLERYGMTEFGMALSNPLRGTRKPGYVGSPLPGVEATIASLKPSNQSLGPSQDQLQQTGELLVQSPGLFREYWNKPEATREAFTVGGFFRTGDTVMRDADGSFKILGRTSVDIIKSGGFKLSALEVEDKLLEHPNVAECAVLGIPDNEYGESVAAIIAPAPDTTEADLPAVIKEWAKTVMAPYKVPRVWRVVESIPRNAMGKVNKKQLKAEFFPDAAKAA